jgi:hypothetical protein
MSHISRKAIVLIIAALAVIVGTGGWIQVPEPGALNASVQYPEPRFPAPPPVPQSWKDVVPYARELYQNKLGFAGYSLGLPIADQALCSPLIVFSASVDPMVVQAITRVNIEHHQSAYLVHDYDLVGVSKQDAEALEQFNHTYTAESGFMAVGSWIQTWPDPNVPRQWLKSTLPDLYALLYPSDHVLSAHLEAAAEKLTTESVGKAVQEFIRKTPDVNPGVFWGSGDWVSARRALGPLASEWLGPALFNDRWMLMNEAPVASQLAGLPSRDPLMVVIMKGVPTYPDDVWQLSEEKTIEPLALADRVRITDPEGTDLSFEIPEEMAQRWAKGAYERGHIMLYPTEATGRFARSTANYPASALGGTWIPRAPLASANGVVAGTTGDHGFFPRIEIHYKDGYVSDVVGGGTFGDLLRAFLKYPNINSANYPYADRPGFFHLYEVAMGTHPKWFRDPESLMGGDLAPEGRRSGVLHFAVGFSLEYDDPGSAEKSSAWQAFAARNNLPTDHGFDLYNYFATYRVHLRNSDKWIDLIDRGHMTSLDDPKVRALASRYGDPDRILAERWIPEIPGINTSGRYEDYSREPWKYSKAVIHKVIGGTYDHYYPPIERAK